MELAQFVRRGFWAIGDIGVTSETRPEEKKHIRFLNIAVLFFGIFSLGWAIQGLADVNLTRIKPLAQFASLLLIPLIYFFNYRGWHNAARIYAFMLFYGAALFLFPLTGKAVVDHYFVFIGIASAFLAFPSHEKTAMVLSILLGFLCYAALWTRYWHMPVRYSADTAVIEFLNQIILYNIFAVFLIFMLTGRYFTARTEAHLVQKHAQLAEMSELLKKMFGRYLSPGIMAALIENPSALELGGQKRKVTILMTDLRGFTAISERMPPEAVVHILNAYFEVMVDVVHRYQGTVIEFIGDALLIVFGAPQDMPDRSLRAVACAIEMQNAMAEVNQANRALGLPELEMGIGLNADEVVVGNIGSSKRSNYTVVGSGVNMTSRIESYAVGGQILISESVRKEVGETLRIDGEKMVRPKGAVTPLRIYEVGGIGGPYQLSLASQDLHRAELARRIPVSCTPLEGKAVGRKKIEGIIVRLSKKSAEIRLAETPPLYANLKINLRDVEEELQAKDFYGKVTESVDSRNGTHIIRFTAVPLEVSAYFQSHRQHAAPFEKAEHQALE